MENNNRVLLFAKREMFSIQIALQKYLTEKVHTHNVLIEAFA